MTARAYRADTSREEIPSTDTADSPLALGMRGHYVVVALEGRKPVQVWVNWDDGENAARERAQ